MDLMTSLWQHSYALFDVSQDVAWDVAGDQEL